MDSPLKWMGSKKKLIPFIKNHIPEKYNTFIEPFAGSAIVTLSEEPENTIIADLQSEPIMIFNAIKDEPEKFHQLFAKHSNELWDGGSDYYYNLRSRYNKHKTMNVKYAAIFMVLLRAGFNGLVRFNPKGEWSVPFGDRGHKNSKKQASRLDNSFLLERIKGWSNYLNTGRKKIIQQSFIETIQEAQEGDFLYCDPPYLITTQQYKSWTQEHELQLAQELKAAHKRGVAFILSNVYKYKDETNDDLLGLYNEFDYELKSHDYVVGPKQSRRQSVEEVIIFNQ